MHPRLLLLSCLLVPMAALAQDEDETKAKEAMIAGTRANVAAYEVIPSPKADNPVSVNIKLGETTSNYKGEVYDGIRITAPDDLAGRDFVWYFNAPGNWANWYIIPVSEDFAPGFENWLYADKLYRGLDKPQEKNRTRALQTLNSAYFRPGAEYILWFRRVAQDDETSPELRAVFHFATRPADKKKWDQDSIEKALKLKDAPDADQMAALDSRGGRIMLDATLFDPSDASRRIKNVLFSIRQTTHYRSGMFITVETSCPPCRRSPTLAAIREKYGPADFVETAAEVRKKEKHAGNEPGKDDEHVTTHYYDYFAFEVSDDDPDGKIQQVKTQASDFSQLKPPATGGFFGTVPMKNLAVFYLDGHEVGRFYYFMEGGKSPLCIQEPPVAKYTSDNVVMDYQGGGKWEKQSMQDGKVSYRASLSAHRLNGLSEGFYPDGRLKFKVPYKDGELHGEGIQYTEDGKVSERQRFIEGAPVKEEEKTAPRKGPAKAPEAKSKPKPL